MLFSGCALAAYDVLHLVRKFTLFSQDLLFTKMHYLACEPVFSAAIHQGFWLKKSAVISYVPGTKSKHCCYVACFLSTPLLGSPPVMTFICFRYNIRLKNCRDSKEIQEYSSISRGCLSLTISLQVCLSASFSNHCWIWIFSFMLNANIFELCL